MTTISLSAPLESRWDMSLPMRLEERVGCVSVMHMHTHTRKGTCVCVGLFLLYI